MLQSLASPARRTVETARALGLEPVLVPELGRAGFFGDWTGRRHDELAATGGDVPMRSSGAIRRTGGRRAAKVLRIRSRASGCGLSRIGAGSATLVVHSGTIRAALCIALGSDTTSGPALRDRSVVTDPDRPARHRLARRRRLISARPEPGQAGRSGTLACAKVAMPL